MFPLTQSTILILILIAAVALASIAALRKGWAQRLLLWAMAGTGPYIVLWLDPPVGEFAGLAYMLVGLYALGTLLVGSVLGWGLRYVRPSHAVAVLAVVILSAAGFELGRQYVPEACLKRPLPVSIDNTDLHVPAVMRARIERADDKAFFGRKDRKYGTASLCRASDNGTSPVPIETLWITPAAHADQMSETCGPSGGATGGPSWCQAFRHTPYQHIGSVILSTNPQRTAPVYYWERQIENLRSTKSGDLTKGWLCVQGGYKNTTSCWLWEPYGSGDLRIMVETLNFDPVFQDMPVEDALKMASDAKTMIREILQP